MDQGTGEAKKKEASSSGTASGAGAVRPDQPVHGSTGYFDAPLSPSSLPPRFPPRSQTAGLLKPGKLVGGGGEDMLVSDAAGGGGGVVAGGAGAQAGSAAGERPPALDSHQRKVSWGHSDMLENGIPAVVQPENAVKPTMPEMRMRSWEGDTNYSEDSFVNEANSASVDRPYPAYLAQPDLAAATYTSNPSPGSGDKAINLQDMLSENPLGNEAETLILKAIERQDAINQNNHQRKDTASSIFGNIPVEAVNVFGPPPDDLLDSANDSRATTKNRNRLNTLDSRKSGRSTKTPEKLPKPLNLRNKTTEQTLASLTMAMADFHDRDYRHEDDSRQVGGGGIDATLKSAGEAFAQNANIVFRGKKKVDDEVEKEGGSSNWGRLRASVKPSEAAAVPAPSAAASRWGKLKTSIHTPGGLAVDEHKKTDGAIADDIPNDVEFGSPVPLDDNIDDDDDDDNIEPHGEGLERIDEVAEPSSGPKSRRRARKKLIVQSGAVKDFQIFVAQRRSSFLANLRFLILFICPATAVSFILFYWTGECAKTSSSWIFLRSRMPLHSR